MTDNRYDVPLWDDEYVLELDSRHGYTTWSIY